MTSLFHDRYPREAIEAAFRLRGIPPDHEDVTQQAYALYVVLCFRVAAYLSLLAEQCRLNDDPRASNVEQVSTRVRERASEMASQGGLDATSRFEGERAGMLAMCGGNVDDLEPLDGYAQEVVILDRDPGAIFEQYCLSTALGMKCV